MISDIKNGESKILEFKEELPANDSIVKTVIAFANTSGGKLVIGVSDDRELIGLKGEDIFELQDKISSIIYDNCTPKILPEIYIENNNNTELLVIEINRGPHLPYHYKKLGREKGTFVRIGATNRVADFNYIIELERQRLNISFDEEINYDTKLEDLDLSPIKNAFSKLNKPLDKQKLINLKLIKIENNREYPTNGLLIILGIFEHVEVKCGRFKGTTMEIFLDKKEFSNDLFSQLDSTMAFIKTHINLRGEIIGLQRVDTYEIPVIAIREAVINAIIHRDYSNFGRDIKIGIYDDIINIVSPGSFPFGLTLDEIMEGRSEIRNKTIARVFKELEYIEQWGSGIQKITQICKERNLKEPKLTESGDFIDIEFYRPQKVLEKIPEKVSEKVSEKTSEKVSEKTSEKIIKHLKENNKLTILELSVKIGITTRSIERNINTLQKNTRIKRIGPDNGGHWMVYDK